MAEKKPYQKRWVKKETYKPKRGKLSTLLTDEQKESAKIQELTYDFSCRIIRLYQYLTEDAEYKVKLMKEFKIS